MDWHHCWGGGSWGCFPIVVQGQSPCSGLCVAWPQKLKADRCTSSWLLPDTKLFWGDIKLGGYPPKMPRINTGRTEWWTDRRTDRWTNILPAKIALHYVVWPIKRWWIWLLNKRSMKVATNSDVPMTCHNSLPVGLLLIVIIHLLVVEHL